MTKIQIAIIGGGASGVFCAIELSNNSNFQIDLYEKSTELLKKVKISGGGRCNVTHQFSNAKSFAKNYPRGKDLLNSILTSFSPLDMRNWLNKYHIETKVERDGRVFPISDNSQTIIDCFVSLLKKSNISILYNHSIDTISFHGTDIEVNLPNQKKQYQYVVVATGGATNVKYLDCFATLQINIVTPVPSLFTFRINEDKLTELMGLSVPNAILKIQKSKLIEQGALLITHWGLSGPIVLKLSAWGAFELYERNYTFNISIQWDENLTVSSIQKHIEFLKKSQPNLKLKSIKWNNIPQRLWLYILDRIAINHDIIVANLTKKDFNKLINELTHAEYCVEGKSTYKDEFVTAGGIDLSEINWLKMCHKRYENLYFVGEVLDVDGITGGFNFQNAWSTAYIAAQSILNNN